MVVGLVVGLTEGAADASIDGVVVGTDDGSKVVASTFSSDLSNTTAKEKPNPTLMI